ncbi:cyclic nucleotide-binding protein [Methylocella silvestris BL2]|uniref:Cyclic nucleotide-binding protein n=1 Tax=Methylocella silvestris (strain DSM 15510 / CIP 108128 / LMG 27833 / NCIMB 13906 / BL2) TaxID=395965 RepID=B8EKL4_METSB|nr:cyclic nucleotide-binding and patatin-like phospholipase domain-containing protein [Methylocella silvestris]ACK51384.1 cyclic nucleotide-binding protein [Methylocella silvestris BL2]
MPEQATVASEQIAALRGLELFRDLSDKSLSLIAGRLRVRELARGELLLKEGDDAFAFYLVLSGRFEARVAERDQIVAEIGPGQPIGEIAFFAGGRRRASVIALRPSTVIEIDYVAFERIKALAPGVERTLIEWLAKRLDATTRNMLHLPKLAPASGIAIVRGGSGAVPPLFFERLAAALSGSEKARILSSVTDLGAEPAPPVAIFLTDETLTEWTRARLRLADELVVVVDGDEPQPPNEIEAFAFELIPPARRRLVRLHPRRRGAVTGTRRWLEGRDMGMIHHVSLEDGQDFASLSRFLTGRATGFVAGGGGAFGVAHIGVYKALSERGLSFDMFGGSSVGSGMAAAFALLRGTQEVLAGVRHIFIESRALRKMTIPRYSLLDHRPFDEALKRRYGETDIEDVWKPFFAIATDLSMNRMQLLRSGPVWRAVRASSSIPGVLPPVITKEGAMLVDGAIADNVPLEPMASLKSGPNVVVSLGLPPSPPLDVDYDRLPGRLELALAYLNPLRRNLPPCPGPISVIQKSVFSNARQDCFARGREDLILSPPASAGSSFLDWSRFEDVFETSYEWARRELQRLEEEGDPALAALDGSRE